MKAVCVGFLAATAISGARYGANCCRLGRNRGGALRVTGADWVGCVARFGLELGDLRPLTQLPARLAKLDKFL